MVCINLIYLQKTKRMNMKNKIKKIKKRKKEDYSIYTYIHIFLDVIEENKKKMKHF